MTCVCGVMAINNVMCVGVICVVRVCRVCACCMCACDGDQRHGVKCDDQRRDVCACRVCVCVVMVINDMV